MAEQVRLGGEDQLSFLDPTSRYPVISPPEQRQEEPGLQQDMTPLPDIGEHSYRGTGRLVGRKALVTGGDSGIGAAVAVAFAREGADVAIHHLPGEEPDAQHVLDIIASCGVRARRLVGDFTDVTVAGDVVDGAAEELGGLDILVNNAGKQVAVEHLQDLDDEQVSETFHINIMAMFTATRRALAHLPAGASIINTASVEAYLPSPVRLDYAATKGAINNFSKGSATQLAPHGIRVNAVAPGPIWTVIQPSNGQPIRELPQFGQGTPLGRAGQPAEVAPAFVFLASPESSYVVGETLNVNGGMPSP